MFEKEDLNNKIIKIKEESHNMALALDYINEMNNIIEKIDFNNLAVVKFIGKE